MKLHLREPGDLVRTVDAGRRYIRTYVVNNYGDLILYDDGLLEATNNTGARLDTKVAGEQ